MRQGIPDRREYAWRDHRMLVGRSYGYDLRYCLTVPILMIFGTKRKPRAGLPVDGTSSLTIYELFSQLFTACVEDSSIRFLSRYDKSANNIKESSIWIAIGQKPWAHPYSNWYHRYVEFPLTALKAACVLGEYTITDRGTWLSVEEEIREKMSVFVCYEDFA